VTVFTNLSLIVSFFADIGYYNRALLWTDIVGGLLLVLFTSANGILSNINHEAKQKKKEELEKEKELLTESNTQDDKEAYKEDGANRLN
jgi:hypothetical protein